MDGLFSSAFFWAQCIGLVAMSINILAWQLKNPRWVIFSFCPASSLWAIQYYLLNAPLGVVLNLCSAIKDGLLAFIGNKYVPYLIGTFLLFIWAIGLHFFTHWYDILPLLSGTIINVALLQRDNRPLVARAGIAATVCWLLYNVIVHSYMGFASGAFSILSSIIGMARFEGWELGKCYKTFLPSLTRRLFVFPNFRTYP